MPLVIDLLSAALGVEARGLDLRQPPDADTARALVAAFEQNSVLCIREQRLSPAQLLTVAKLFGTPKAQVNKHQQLPDAPEVAILSSESRVSDGRETRLVQGTTWHTDHSFTVRPPKATLLYAVRLPESGGDTSFCNMRAAYAALPTSTRERIGGLNAVHSYESSRSPRKMMRRTTAEEAQSPDVTHPLVRFHEPTASNALYLSTTRLERIVELERTASDALLDELMVHVDQEQFVYHHAWQAGDVVIWDNRCLMHHANADFSLDQPRLMHRVLIEGEAPLPGRH